MSFFDRFIGFFSAKSSYRRESYRKAAELVRKYEGASLGRRTKSWRAPSTSANAEVGDSLITLRNRARQMVRDNPYMAKAIQAVTGHTVGRGIFTQVKVDLRGRNGNQPAKAREERFNKIWNAWAQTTAIDYDGQHNFHGIQRLVMRAVAESGEALIRLKRAPQRIVRGMDGEDVEVPPLQIQVLESDFLDARDFGTKNTTASGNRILQGIEFNPSGQRVAYHLFKEHPGEVGLSAALTGTETIRVPADEVLHIFRADRPGQQRGVSWISPSLIRARDLDLYEDAQLVRQQVAACFSVFIRDLDGADIGGPLSSGGEISEKVAPGIIEILPPGKDISFASPPPVENYNEHTSSILRSIAAGIGISYECLTGDFSQVNFSSSRMSFLEMNRNVEAWRANILVPQLLNPIFDYFVNGLELLGHNTARVRPVFTPPRREMVDPSKEVSALKEAIRSGLMSQSEAVRNAGYNPQTLFQEIADDNEKLDELNIVLDSDPRQDKKAEAVLPSTSAPEEEGAPPSSSPEEEGPPPSSSSPEDD